MTLFGHLCVWLALCLPPEIIGPVTYVFDGDTIRIDRFDIRLQGVDAPELSEPTGHAAREVMMGLVTGKIVACTADGTTSHARIVARCYIDGIDIAIPMIAGGWDLDCPKFSGGRYRGYELPGIRGQHIQQKAYCR